MGFFTKNAGVIALIALVIAVGGYFYPQVQKGFGQIVDTFTGDIFDATTSYKLNGTAFYSSTGLTVGSGGTALANIITGNCTIWTPATTITGTTTQQAVCQAATNGGISALTGVTTDSICSVRMASSTVTTLAGLVVEGQSASSTAGSIVFGLANLTGATFTWSAAASSSPQWTYTCLDPS